MLGGVVSDVPDRENEENGQRAQECEPQPATFARPEEMLAEPEHV